MIGSHDSFTYLDALNSLVNNFTKFWRCQDKSVVELYKFGVRFFDIRIIRDEVKGKPVWRCCHGLAELSKIFVSIKAICNYFTITLKDCTFRIWLEKGSDKDWEDFKAEANVCKEEFPNFVLAVRKSGEEILFQKDTYPEMVYLATVMENWKNIAKGIYTNPIKDWAKKHNPEITLEMIDDPKKLYFMDYVCGFED